MESGTSRATEKPKLGNLGRSPPRSPKIQNSYLLRLKFEGVENLESHVQEVENQRRHKSRATDADSPMSFRSPQAQPSHRATVDWNRYSILEEDKFYGARLRAPFRRISFSSAVPEGRSHFYKTLAAQCAAFVLFCHGFLVLARAGRWTSGVG